MPLSVIQHCSKRAGNPMSEDLSLAYTKALDKLATCDIEAGHDCFLNGIFVYFDWKINKIIREHLLRYHFINVISSQSLMHSFSKLNKDTTIKDVDQIPLGFPYWISFCCNYRQLKTIYAQRKHHKRHEWRHFCACLEQLPHAHFITGEKHD